ncbi:response regulator [Candidatus Berkelbacteria bacterium]|nr:response regulator [Candidatus Berkelbacteria bacterium]
MAVKPKILIVEDDDALAGLYQERLEKEGYEVSRANNGQAGMDMAMAELPDLVLLDILMPQRGGLGVLQSLKTWTETKHIPVIIMTALPSEEHRQEGMRLGASAYFNKAQTTPQQIVEEIKKYIHPAE